MDYALQVLDARWQTTLSEEAVMHVLNHCGTHLNQTAFQVSIVLADDAFIQNLNAQYRNKNTPTDVLSFPQYDRIEDIPDHDPMLGDIILSYDRIQRDAQAQEKSFKDHASHMLVHGYLHLSGFDHQTEEEAQTMETLEITLLNSLGIKDPYGS